jgi:hypothetical protein
LASGSLLLPFDAVSDTYVRGYFRSDGTYVQPHYRSSPDGNPYKNWSFPGNVNPHTGKVAPGNPDTYLRNYYGRNGPPAPSTNFRIPNKGSLTVPNGEPRSEDLHTNLPENAQLGYFGHGWECKSGFFRSDQKCLPVPIPENAQLGYFGHGWECKRGFYRAGQAYLPVGVRNQVYSY